MEKESSIRYSQKYSRDMEKEGKILDLLVELRVATGKDWMCEVDKDGIMTFKPKPLSPTPPDSV